VSFANVDDAARLLYTLGHQAIYAAVGIAAAAIAVIFDGRGRAREAELAWWVAGGAGLVLAASMWFTRQRLKRRNRR
jgi:low temperature requirement protein LtrA